MIFYEITCEMNEKNKKKMNTIAQPEKISLLVGWIIKNKPEKSIQITVAL
jgi:hypothetical protein